MAKHVVISADSAADIPQSLIERFSISINPMPITMGEESHFDGVDISAPDVFAFFKNTKTLAKTSAPNAAQYTEYFEKLADGGKNAVIHFCISSDMSGSFNFARLAAEELDDVYCINSQNLSTGISLLAAMAAECAEQGMEVKDIVAQIEDTIPRVDASFVIDTLEFLHKGGRCSAVAMLGANLLKLKPCIEVKNGKMDVGKKYRGKMSAVLQEYTADRFVNPEDIDLHRCFVTHTYFDDNTIPDAVMAQVKETLGFEEVIQCTAGCTIFAHCGPGTLGVLFIRKTPIQ